MGTLGRRVRRRGRGWYRSREGRRLDRLAARVADHLDSPDHLRIEGADLGLIGAGVTPDGFHRIARKLFYPKRWDREQAQLPPIIDHMVNCVGVTEADVRDVCYLVNRDALVVRTWNWRKFAIDGRHQHEHSLKHEESRNKKWQ
jgi:hypothetical protein